jgi:2-amino-4-hydroxy-6-hydroxymethyldihydropteridine diphosphokinase
VKFVFAGNFEPETGNYSVHTLVYLSMGSNLGDRAVHLRFAIERLHEFGKVAAVSSFYETEPIEVVAQPWFLNCVVKLDTEKTPWQLLAGILNLEREMGRERKQNKGPRLIDVDILLFGDSIIASQGLTVPHPAMRQRRFVLEPLAEIAPEVRHPVLKRTVRELQQQLPAGQTVRKWIESRNPSPGI